MKKTLLAITITALSCVAIPTVALADGHMGGKHKDGAEHGKEFFKNLAHASFMPNIMKHLKKNKTELKITDEQMQQLQTYHMKNSPEVKNMVKDLMWTENKARNMALNNFPPQQVIEVGELSLKIRHDIMIKKVQCRSFLKTVLTPEQYKQALTSYDI